MEQLLTKSACWLNEWKLFKAPQSYWLLFVLRAILDKGDFSYIAESKSTHITTVKILYLLYIYR